MRQLKLGTIGRCVVTGFTGRLMAKATYLTGCDRYLITPHQGITKHDGTPADNMWVDVIIIEVVDSDALQLPKNASKHFKLGSRAKSVITGFEGVITGRAEHLNGTVEFVLQAADRQDGKTPPSAWADSVQMEQLDVPGIVLPSEEQESDAKPVIGLVRGLYPAWSRSSDGCRV